MTRIQSQLISYNHRGSELEGFVAYDASKTSPKPGIILCHAWRGRDEFVEQKAMEIATWGYTAFALDLYGKGVLGKNKKENSALMSPFVQDRHFLKERLFAALEAFKQSPFVDKNNIAVMGFCFGGMAALDYARHEAGIKGAISVHGLLFPPSDYKKRQIKSKILVLHGFDDPMVPPEQLRSFENEMTEANADWQLHVFGGTKHAFTTPDANDPAFGTVYNPIAAKRSWIEIRNFLQECFENG